MCKSPTGALELHPSTISQPRKLVVLKLDPLEWNAIGRCQVNSDRIENALPCAAENSYVWSLHI